MERPPTIEELLAKVTAEAPLCSPDDERTIDDPRDKVELSALKKLRRMRFAQCLVRNAFDARAAFREYKPRLRLKPGSKWPYLWANNRYVLLCVREILQKAYLEAKIVGSRTMDEIAQVNLAMIFGDITSLLEQTRVIDTEGHERIVTSLRPISNMTAVERMLLHKIRFKDGEVTGLESYNRIDAIKSHLALLAYLKGDGAADVDFNREHKRRMDEARRLSMERAVEAGKVVMLPRASNG